MGNCLDISNSFSILALLMRLSTLKHKKQSPDKGKKNDES